MSHSEELVRKAGAQIGELTWRRRQAEDDARVKAVLNGHLQAAQQTIARLREEVHRLHGPTCECAFCPQPIPQQGRGEVK